MVIPFYKPKRKADLIAHLERDHSRAVTVKIEPHRWTVRELEETHRIIHLGLGAGADHRHG